MTTPLSPIDPRGAIAEALVAGGAPSDGELACLIGYRDGIDQQGLNAAVRSRWTDHVTFRVAVLAHAERGELDAAELSKLLAWPIAFEPELWAMVARLVQNGDPRLRRALVNLIGWPDALEHCPELALLAKDQEREIREAAHAAITSPSGS